MYVGPRLRFVRAMRLLPLVFLSVFLIADGGVLAQLPNALGDKGATATAPPVPLVPLHPIQDSRPSLKEIALTIDPSDQTVGERVQEFGNRKDVLKTVLIGKPGTSVSTLVEVKLPEGTLSKRPAHQVYLCLSLFLPTKGRAHLTVRRKGETNRVLYRGAIHENDSVQPAIVNRSNGWIDLQIGLDSVENQTTWLVLELTGDPHSSSESIAYWATCSLHLVSQVKHEEMDPTKQTLFQQYSDRGYGQLIDVATGKVLRNGIGIGWIGTNTTCLFSKDGSHVAILNKVHDHPRSGSTDYEHLWVFALRPFKEIQETKSRRFRDIRFDQDNRTLLFESDGAPEISGR